MNKKFAIPGLAAIVVAALDIGAAFWVSHDRASSVASSAFKGTPDEKLLQQLEDSNFTIQPLDQPRSTDDGFKAAESALTSFSFLSTDNIQEVMFAQVGSKPRNLEPTPTWVVFLTNVKSRSLGSTDMPEQSTNMVVLVDPETFKYTWAIQS